MNKTIVTLVTAAAVSLSVGAAHAGGWGSKGHKARSGSLVNVSPSVDVGDITALNGNRILNNSAILSGNSTNVGNGILSGIGVGILSGNKSGGKKRR